MSDTTCPCSMFLLPTDLDAEKNAKYLILNAWNVQNIAYELIVNYCVSNTPQSLGFTFTQTYDPDYTKSGIQIDLSYNLQKAAQNKRPAIFVSRGPEEFKYPTFAGSVGGNSAESEDVQMAICTMPIVVSCIGTNLGLAEMLAEYVKQPLLSFRRQIRSDFNLREWKLVRVGPPKNVVEPKDHFVIELELMTAFDEGSIVKGDDLKLKTVSKYLFDKVTCTQVCCE